MKGNKAYVNGRITAIERARISPLDRGLNYGDGLFETIKAEHGRPVYVKEHLARLKSGALALGFSGRSLKPLLSDIHGGAIEKLLKANGLGGAKTSFVKIVVTRGASERGLLPPSSENPSFIITAGEVDEKALARMRKRGLRAIVSSVPPPPLPGVKTLDYMPAVLAMMEARKAGADEAIFAGPGGELTEATTANLFVVEKGVIITPPVSEDPFAPGVLPGVTRKTVILLAGSMDMPLMTQRIHADDLKRCTEAFLTGSVRGVVPLVQVDGRPIGTGAPGPVTRAIQKALHPLG